MVRGYQGDDLSRSNALMACVKHFALYGAAEAGRDYNTVDMSRLQMYNYYLPPYRAAVEAGVGSVMSSFNEIDGVPATANHWLLTDLLRTQWGFQGFVVTDYAAISEMTEHGMGDLRKDAELALKAGVDMDMVSENLPQVFAGTGRARGNPRVNDQSSLPANPRGQVQARIVYRSLSWLHGGTGPHGKSSRRKTGKPRGKSRSNRLSC